MRSAASSESRACERGVGGEHLARPPRAHGVVQQEEYHVALCEELGHSGKFVRADLLAARVDAVFLLGAPVLVGPSERILRREDLGGKRFQEFLQLLDGFEREREVEDRVVGGEDAGQHRLRPFAGQLPGIASLFPGKLPAIVQRDGHPILGRDEQFVLGQEACEEHAVPVLVRGLVGEVVGLLGVTGRNHPVTRLAPPGAESVAEGLLTERHGVEGPGVTDGQRGEHLGGTGFGHAPGLLDDGAKPGTEVGGEGEGHAGVLTTPPWRRPLIAQSVTPTASPWGRPSVGNQRRFDAIIPRSPGLGAPPLRAFSRVRRSTRARLPRRPASRA